MTERLVWERDGRDWPNRASSRFVEAGGLRWHVQQMGEGPTLLLLHGTGASTHSWRDLAPRLAQRFNVVAPDLPGHGFTALPPPSGLSLGGMSAGVAVLVDALGITVEGVVAHSAGAAVGVTLALDRRLAPRLVVGLNAALLPLDGVARFVFPPVARLMAATSLPARVFALRSADPAAVRRLVEGTGSMLDGAGLALYARLVGDVKHVSAALGMMARWNLDRMAARLRGFEVPLDLVVGDRDRAVPIAHARDVLALLPSTTRSSLTVLEGVGHLAHEERPEAVARAVEAAWARAVARRTAVAGRST